MARALHGLVFLLVGGCGARTSLGVGETIVVDAGAGTTHTFHGKFELHYFPDYGQVIVPKDLSRSVVQLFTNDGVVAGAGKSDGTFEIAGVSAIGPVTLRVDELMVVGAADGVTLVENLSGRATRDRSPWANGPPAFELTLDGLAPMPPHGSSFFDGAWLILGSAVAGCELFSVEQQWQPKPAVGAVSVSDAFAQMNPADPSCRMELGDSPFLLQIVNAFATPNRVTSIRKIDRVSVSTQDAAPIRLNGTFQTVPINQLQIDFRPSSYLPALFVAGADKPTANLELAERPPISKYAAPWIGVGAYPGQSEGPIVVEYPDVFPTWTKTLAVAAATRLQLKVPNSPDSISREMTINGTVDVTASSTQPIAISLSPPRNVLVGAAPPFAPVTDAGQTPTIHWDPPDYGPVGLVRYSVAILDVSPTPLPAPPTIWTLETRVAVPPGFLQAGHMYVAQVTVYWTQEKPDFATHPLDGDLHETASTPSGVFTP